MKSSEYKNRLSRREFLRIPRPKNDVILILDKEKCTGCGLCAIDCPTKALTLSLNGERDAYQILFRQEICDACGVCEKSCPEGCLQLEEQGPEQDRSGKETKVNPERRFSTSPSKARLGAVEWVIFDDKISKCMECGIPLYPQAMVKKLESKIFVTKEHTWPLHLCPSCRMKSQFEKEITERIKT
jgi:ferredoxin